MNKLWLLSGRLAYYITFPVVAFIIRFTTRTRLIVEAKGEILVVKGWLGDGKWMLPGGGLHKGESPKSGAIRELLEETGIKLAESQLNHIKTGSYKSGITKFKYHLFLVKLDNKTASKKQFFEITDTTWLKSNKINERNSSKELIELLSIWK